MTRSPTRRPRGTSSGASTPRAKRSSTKRSMRRTSRSGASETGDGKPHGPWSTSTLMSTRSTARSRAAAAERSSGCARVADGRPADGSRESSRSVFSQALRRLSIGLRHGPKFDRQCALFLIIVERLDEHVSREGLHSRVLYAPASGAQDDLLGRARGDGWDAAGGPVPRAETRVPCLFKHVSLSRGEHVAWEDPRPRGTRLVAPRPPAYSPPSSAPRQARGERSPTRMQPKRKPRVTDGSTRVV